MTVWEWVILMVVFGIVSTIELIFIGAITSKVFERKIETKTKLELEIFEKEMTKVTELLDTYMDKMLKMINGETDKEKEALKEANKQLAEEIRDLKMTKEYDL